jgi:peptidyl-prolyl cis-trans isomerase B (cyclophilin B)
MRENMRNILKIFILTLIIISMSICYSQKTKEDKSMVEREVAVIETKFGNIIIDFFENVAPKHITQIKKLISEKFYDSLYFHRVIPGFVVQGGDPNTRDTIRSNDGMGQAGQQTIPAEFSSIPHKRGILSTARKPNDINSATSQFFICVADLPQLDGQYTIFGKIIEGMEIVDKIVNVPRDKKDNPNEPVYMKKVYLKKMKVKPAEENIAIATPEPSMGEVAVLETSLGNITLAFYDKFAPKHTAQIKRLIKEKFYDSTAFHRVIPGFMIQGGDPYSKDTIRSNFGMGNSPLPNIPAEFSKLHHLRGIVSAARTDDPNSANCQFFICVADAFFLDNKYSIFGKVLDGMDVVDKIVNVPRDENDSPWNKVVIKKVYLKKVK